MRYALPLLLAFTAAAQEPRLEVDSRLVLVPVSVTGSSGRPVEGIEPFEFLVFDNGRPRRVTVDTIDTGVAPLALVAAVQCSEISAASLAKVRRIGGMVQPLITGERGVAALVTFSSAIEWRQDFTNDAALIGRAFDTLRPAGGKRARMLDAVKEAVDRLRKRQNVRRVLLLISESRDRGSETDLTTAVVEAQTAGVAIYAVTYSALATAFTQNASEAGSPPQPGRVPLADQTQKDVRMPSNPANPPIQPEEQRLDLIGLVGELARRAETRTAQVLAAGTGGAEFSFVRRKGLEEAIQKLGGELHSQYVLSFTPANPSPGYHRLEVRLTRPGKLRVRARPGYWSVE